MSLLYSETEEALRTSVRGLLEKTASWPDVLARTESGSSYDADLLRRLSDDIGVSALAVPEEAGGAGATWREAAVVAEEVGRAVAPVPYLGSALAVAALGADEAAADAADVAFVVTATAAPDADFPAAMGIRGGRISGTVTRVLDAVPAARLVVPVSGPEGPALYVVDAGDATVAPRTSLDMTRPLADVTLEGASGRLVAEDEAAAQAFRRALAVGTALAAAEQVGLTERCLELTVAHLKERYQFGRPIGSFQALKHRAADVWAELVQARAAARYAVDAVVTGADRDVAVALAGAHCSDVAVHAAEECVQLHGGLGFSWENAPHLYLKRAKALQLMFGTPDRHRARLAGLVGLPA